MASSKAGNATEERAKLDHKIAEATQFYAKKYYNQAAELYSEATEMQDELNGEMHPENAHLLYLYGRCLYHVAVSNSDVLGGKAATDSSKQNVGEKRGKKRKIGSDEDAAEETNAAAAENSVSAVESGAAKDDAQKNKPLFQIEGDDADWDSDEDEDEEGEDAGENGAGGEEGGEEEEDDFAIAYEVLDLARVLLTRQIEAKEKGSTDIEASGKSASSAQPVTGSGAVSSPQTLYDLQELLADTHDLQAEICLENERFEDAVADSTSSLELKQKLYPEESSLVAEAHYKLSLALEFASVTKAEAEQVDVGMIASVLSGGRDDDVNGASSAAAAAKKREEDEASEKANLEKRRRAAEHMEAAIASSRLRVKLEKENLKSLAASASTSTASTSEESMQEVRAKKEREIKDVEEIIADMQQRLLDLRTPPDTAGSSSSASTAKAAAVNADLGGILGSLMGQAPGAQKKILDEAVKGANDLSGMVKRKKKDTDQDQDDDGQSGDAASRDGKKAKLDETA